MAIQAKLEKAKKFAEMTMNGNSNISLTDGKLDLDNFKNYMEQEDISIDIMIRAIEEVSGKRGLRPVINYEEIADGDLAKYSGGKNLKSHKRGKELLLKKLYQLGYPVKRVYVTDERWELRIGDVDIIALSLKDIANPKNYVMKSKKPLVHVGLGAGSEDSRSISISIVHNENNDLDDTRFFILTGQEAMKRSEHYRKEFAHRKEFAAAFGLNAEDENNWKLIDQKLKS